MKVLSEAQPHDNHFDRVLQDYRTYLQDDGKAKRTIDSYLSDIARFLDYHAGARARPLQANTRADVVELLEHVRPLGLKPATFNKLVNSRSCFFSYLAERETYPPPRCW